MYPYVLMHEGGCKGEAFYLKGMPGISDYTQPNEAIGVNGELFTYSDQVTCTTCHSQLYPGDIIPMFVKKR